MRPGKNACEQYDFQRSRSDQTESTYTITLLGNAERWTENRQKATVSKADRFSTALERARLIKELTLWQAALVNGTTVNVQTLIDITSKKKR